MVVEVRGTLIATADPSVVLEDTKMKKCLVVCLISFASLLSSTASAAEPEHALREAFPAAHLGALGGVAHFFEYDFGGIGPMVGVVGAFDPFTFLSVDARASTMFASTAVLGRIAHGRPGRWGGVYLGPRVMHPISVLLPGPGIGGTIGYEYRFEFVRAALDFTAGYGFSQLDYQMGEVFLSVGYSFNSGRSFR